MLHGFVNSNAMLKTNARKFQIDQVRGDVDVGVGVEVEVVGEREKLVRGDSIGRNGLK